MPTTAPLNRCGDFNQAWFDRLAFRTHHGQPVIAEVRRTEWAEALHSAQLQEGATPKTEAHDDTNVFQKVLDNENARTGSNEKLGTFRYRVTSCVAGSNVATLVVLTEHLSMKEDVLTALYSGSKRNQEDDEAPPPLPRTRPPRQAQRRFAAVEASEIAERYQSGQTMNQLARAYRVHRRTIAHCLQKQAVPLRQVGLAPEHLETAAALYRAGWSLARIGDKYGTTDMTVRRALALHGVQIRPRRGSN